ncbi:hypothetical protein [Salsuginibacillus kocurii]|uniref:hypothetical protein n=1 Tax=Salsuginibacillus kocurii TaxID=427078 RepID=UPI00036B1ABB|nr:hypothetical protein [Salsuginibacillus kocurii]
MTNEFALHETLEVQEIAAFKTVSLTKAKTMQPLVSDPALKKILQQDEVNSTRHVEELRDLLLNAKGDKHE